MALDLEYLKRRYEWLGLSCDYARCEALYISCLPYNKRPHNWDRAPALEYVDGVLHAKCPICQNLAKVRMRAWPTTSPYDDGSMRAKVRIDMFEQRVAAGLVDMPVKEEGFFDAMLYGMDKLMVDMIAVVRNKEDEIERAESVARIAASDTWHLYEHKLTCRLCGSDYYGQLREHRENDCNIIQLPVRSNKP